jgi:uncharacterized membrane protein
MKTPIILAAFLVAGAAQAVPPVSSAAPAAKPQQPTATQRKIPGVSDEGNAVLLKAQSTPDPLLQQLAAKARAAHDQLMSAVMAPVIDPDKVGAAMKAENDAQGQIRDHATERLIAVVKSLPSDDRGTFLRTLILARQQRAAQANPPASTPKP